MKHAYVYYRIDLTQAGLAASRIDTLLASMAAFCSRPPRRLIRCENPETWMEVYEGIPDMADFVAALNSAVEALRCGDFTPEERHLECFAAPGFV
ncbi:MAG: DUF4936 family protein [Thiobacillus sp.]|nr:DUF4936 family protein [Thiobacillus sp.]